MALLKEETERLVHRMGQFFDYYLKERRRQMDHSGCSATLKGIDWGTSTSEEEEKKAF
jgi:hypothetical protein